MDQNLEKLMTESGFDTDELSFIIKYASHLGYSEAIRRLDPRPWWYKQFKRLIWVGGWENSVPKYIDTKNLWSMKRSLGRKNELSDPFPIALFGHFITFMRWCNFTIYLKNINSKWGYIRLSCDTAYSLPNRLYWKRGQSKIYFWRTKDAKVVDDYNIKIYGE